MNPTQLPRHNFSFSPDSQLQRDLDCEEIESRYMDTSGKGDDSERRHRQREDNFSISSETNFHKLKGSRLFQKFVKKEMGSSLSQSTIPESKSKPFVKVFKPIEEELTPHYSSFGRIQDSPKLSVPFGNQKSNLNTLHSNDERELDSKSEIIQPNSLNKVFGTPARSPSNSRQRDDSTNRHQRVVDDYRNFKSQISPDSMGQSKELPFTTTQRFPSPGHSRSQSQLDKNDLINTLREKVFDLTNELSQREIVIENLRKKTNDEQIFALNNRIHELEANESLYITELRELEIIKSELHDEQSEKAQLQLVIQELRATLESKESPQNINHSMLSKKEEEIHHLRRSHEEAKNENSNLKAALRKTDAELTNLLSRFSQNEDENSGLRSSLQDFQTKFLETSSSLDEIAYENSHLKDEIMRFRIELEQVNEELISIKTSSTETYGREKRVSLELENSRVEIQQLRNERGRHEKIIEELRNQVTELLYSKKPVNQPFHPIPPPSSHHQMQLPRENPREKPQLKINEPIAPASSVPRDLEVIQGMSREKGNLYQQFLNHRQKEVSTPVRNRGNEDLGEPRSTLDIEKDWNLIYKRNSPQQIKELPTKLSKPSFPPKLENPHLKEKEIANNQNQIQETESLLLSRQLERSQVHSSLISARI